MNEKNPHRHAALAVVQHHDAFCTRSPATMENFVRSRVPDAESTDLITRRFRAKSVLRQPKRDKPRTRSRSLSILHQVPEVEFDPAPPCEDRILSPARLPSHWYWTETDLT